jgi:Cdc6-like AAA superfamily ATPase
LSLQALVVVALSAEIAARTKRQRHTPDGDKQVIVNIENEEKTQYLEQNFNTSKILISNLKMA